MKKLGFIHPLFIFLLYAFSPWGLAHATSEDKSHRLALENAVRQFVAQSANGQFNNHIYEKAQDYAKLMADNYYSIKTTGKSLSPLLGKEMISHNGFEERCSTFPGLSHEEILATVTAWTPEDAAKKIVQCWYKSRDGHKESMMSFHQNFGYGLAKTPKPLPGMDGFQWFAVGLFADGIQHYKPVQTPKPVQPQHQKPVQTPKPVQPQHQKPVQNLKPVQPQHQKPVQNLKPVQPQHQKPVQNLKPVQPQFQKPVHNHRPVQPQFQKPVHNHRPVQPQFQKPVQNHKPVQPQFQKPVQNHKPVQPQQTHKPTIKHHYYAFESQVWTIDNVFSQIPFKSEKKYSVSYKVYY